MLHYLRKSLIAVGISFLCCSSLVAAPLAKPLTSAKIVFIQKDVSVADIVVADVNNGQVGSKQAATLDQSISSSQLVLTGAKSRAELLFNDGTITRLGQFTSFSFKPGTRDIAIKEGSALFNVPKGMGRTQIQAGAVTAAITGTTLLVQVLSDRVLVYVYEGSVEVLGNKVVGGEVITVMNDGKVTKASFDVQKGLNTAALFVKFDGAPGSDTFEELLTALLKNSDRVREEDLINPLPDPIEPEEIIIPDPYSS
jgi:hypothetical protein